MRIPFSYLGNGWTDSADIRYVVRNPLAKHFTKVDVRYVHVQLYREVTAAREHVRIASPYLGNGPTDCTEIWCVAR